MKKKFAKTRFVFDRKKISTNKIPALIQVEVLYDRVRRYFSTGVSVTKNQWNIHSSCICNSIEMDSLNERISSVKGNIDRVISKIMESSEEFSFELLDRKLKSISSSSMSFIDFMETRINDRTDIRNSTKVMQRKNITMLKEFDTIVNFSDLTLENVNKLDNYLHSKGIKQTTIYAYHKVMKVYINDAIRLGYIKENPYLNFKCIRGESEDGRWLTEEEFKRIQETPMLSKSLDKVRDLFVLQCYTGLAYSDLFDADFENLESYKGTHFISGKRNKTGMSYTSVLLPEAMKILQKYNFVLPRISNVKYNLYLKSVAAHCGIDKHIASHWGRRTCGMVLLNKGVSIEVVAKILGHSSIRITESVYAKILDKSAVSEVVEKMTKG